MTRRFLLLFVACALIVAVALPAQGYVAYHTHVSFVESLTKDILKLMPRSMGSYIFQNRWDYERGMTFMTRDIRSSPGKMKDLEEIRREAYARLMRDIPYCVQALKGGDIKLDTSSANLSGRLGMIAYSIILLKMPEFPDLEYLERFSMLLDELIADSQVDVFVYYDGYGDFNSLGELMERFKPFDVPAFRHVKNDLYAATMKEDVFAIFRAPNKFNRQIVLTDQDVNDIYSNIVNDIVDTYTYIWKCSGMDLQHPSYSAPPGTVIARPSRRKIISGGVLSRPPLPAPPVAETFEEPLPLEETAPTPGEVPSPEGPAPEAGAPGR
ncbi:MAG: hypothetical protein HY913_00880 [Desulfomonile tiedjei]|nr:hypothetical protein [Desulfomonile tiedjei]